MSLLDDPQPEDDGPRHLRRKRAARRDLLSNTQREGLRTFALIAASLNLIALIIQLILEITLRQRWGPLDFARESGEAIVQVGLASFIWWHARRKRLSTRQLLSAGTALYVLLIIISTYYDALSLNMRDSGVHPGWVCLIAIIYALLVPAPMRYHAALALVTSAALPVVTLLMWAFSTDGVAWSAWSVLGTAAQAAVPTWICVAVGLLLVRRELRQLDEMARVEQDLDALGSYRLIRKLSEGGMGEVWEASHAFLARPAAIKLVRPALLGLEPLTDAPDAARSTPQAVQVALARFEREARATANLTSPHTIRLYDFGRAADDTFFYAMELLEGVDLETLVQRDGPQPEARMRHLLIQACDSLGEAHALGLIHRDIKPANLFLCRQGVRHDVVKVLDFGLVRELHDAHRPDTIPAHIPELRVDQHAHDVRLTAQGIVTGTPTTMAPEQTMEHTQLDHRVDIYALGCVAYYLVTGRSVFEGDTPTALMRQHLNVAPIPPRARAPQQGISPECEAIIMACLEKSPHARPQSATALASALEAWQPDKPWTAQHAREWARYRPEFYRPSGASPIANPTLGDELAPTLPMDPL